LILRRTHNGQLVLAVEQDVLAAAIYRVDELERESATADDGDVRQVAEPVAISLEMTFVYTRDGRADRAAVAGRHLPIIIYLFITPEGST